jgi:tetratricopeptide (TPR) repeat protein
MVQLKRSVVRVNAVLLLVVSFSGFSPLSADGLQGEYLSTQYWRDLHSRYSPLSNPAFLTEENYLSFRFAGSYVMQTFGLFELGATLPVGLYQTWGLSWFAQTAGSINVTGFSAGGGITDSGITNSDFKNLFMLSYANNIWGRLSIGANASLNYETNFGEPNIGSAVDLGASYRLLFHPVLGDHILGITFQNVLSPFKFGQYSYSNNVKFSWLGYYVGRQVETGLDVDTKNLYNSLNDTNQKMEYTYSFRAGCWLLRVLNLYGLLGSNYFGFAGGVNVPAANNGRDLSVNYQFINRTDAESDMLHSIYVRVQVGQHREEIYAAKMARYIDLAPNELYNKACRLYFSGKYWDAFFIFSQILVQYPSFFKNDWCKYFKGSCLEKMDMREASMDNFQQAKRDYPKSTIIPYVDLGIMRVDYRDDASNLVYDQFSLLNKPEVSDSLKYHAYYLMGQTYFKQKNYQQAAQLFSQIPETHPEYVYAQHSLAIVHIFQLSMEEATNSLGACIEAKAETDAQKEVINRSYVMLGYIFYEQMALSKAVTALRMVPKSSYYYNDALLGLCWAGLRARQWNDCITMGEAIQKSSNQLPLQCDGALIEGYAYMMQKNYDRAFDILQNAQKKTQVMKPPSPDTLELARNGYRTNRKSYAELAQAADKISGELQSSFIVRQIDSLHKDQESDKKKLDDFFVFTDEFARSKFFARNIDVIKNDIEYAVAISQKISHQSTKGLEQQQMQNKSKEIDQEIEKLKQEMEKINAGGGNKKAPDTSK